MEKELALALDFKKAPIELQELATLHYEHLKNLAKEKRQLEKSIKDVDAAQRLCDETAKRLRIALKEWNPEV